MTDAQGSFTPASFANSYRLTSVLNSGKGNQWYGFSVALEGAVKNATIYQRAKEFHDSMDKQNR
jgi:hypothetical protein